jgi:prepilin-type N-terminal cleavage/methylation domain-containing protein
MGVQKRYNEDRAQGFTLLELLMSVAISGIIAAGVIQFYVVAQQSARYQSGVAVLNESGHFSLGVLEQAFERAGSQGGVVGPSFNVQIAPVIWSHSVDSPQYDRVTLQYKTGPTGGYTCTGARASPNTVYISEFEVIPFSGSNVSGGMPSTPLMQLVCRSAKLAQPIWSGNAATLARTSRVDTGIIAAGVEGFQVSYGVRARVAPGAGPQRYVPASAVDHAQDRVVAVRVALLMATVAPAPVLSMAKSRGQQQLFQLLEETVRSADANKQRPDRQLRRVFEASFAVRHG